jgi:eukaryotic-like serine/threonine-protein kinase
MKSGEYDPTLTPDNPDTVPERPTAPTGKIDLSAPEGYELKSIIGRGGMGEVWLAHDPAMERDVALKRMLADRPTPDAEARFLREAKIQARLDHPAIVPVHELGRDLAGRPYFAMKRLAGTTLAELLQEGGSQQRMLRALVDVCLAIALAHTRRIVHRDLKPANIMLGDYGEVYVLDWGVARIMERASTNQRDLPSPSQDLGTQAGQLLGTPGYMAPEQVLGEDVGPPADVYALGSILFEILAGEPLHERGGGAMASTIGDVVASPLLRRPDRATPPELDAICRDALTTNPTARPTVRELADRIQSYLDGDRDVERRRTLAQADLAAAREALAAGDRATTMKLAGRAMTLDPSCDEAIMLATSLIVEPPATVPPEVEKRLKVEEVRLMRERSRRALTPFLAFYLLTPLLPLLNIVSWPTLFFIYVAITGQVAMSFVNWRIRQVPMPLYITYQLVVVFAFSRLTGPFVLTPVLACGMLLSFASIPWLTDRRWALASWSVFAMLMPFLIEAIGITGTTWEMTDRGLLTYGTVLEQRANLDAILTIIANAAIVTLIGTFALGIARDRRKAQRDLYVQAWHLEQLLPKHGGAGTRTISA